MFLQMFSRINNWKIKNSKILKHFLVRWSQQGYTEVQMESVADNYFTPFCLHCTGLTVITAIQSQLSVAVSYVMRFFGDLIEKIIAIQIMACVCKWHFFSLLCLNSVLLFCEDLLFFKRYFAYLYVYWILLLCAVC